MIAFAEDVSGITVSFEFFPPRGEADESFWRTIARLETVSPSFVSVTYGAGGTTRDRTLSTVRRIAAETSLKPAAHLTCVGASRMRSMPW
jgi:methylenetetrahydrofolate reductase (NADPH)